MMFNETVKLLSNWTESDFEVTIDGPRTPYSFTWEL